MMLVSEAASCAAGELAVWKGLEHSRGVALSGAKCNDGVKRKARFVKRTD